jgi:antitoxin component YwqK of YwqJK toxin-antitoxin module
MPNDDSSSPQADGAPLKVQEAELTTGNSEAPTVGPTSPSANPARMDANTRQWKEKFGIRLSLLAFISVYSRLKRIGLKQNSDSIQNAAGISRGPLVWQSRRMVLSVALSLVVLIGIGVWLKGYWGKPGESGSEKTLEELDLREGRLYLADQEILFTGYLIENYPNDDLRARSRVVEGMLHGISEGFYENGQREVQEEFRNGETHGKRLKWYESGAQLSEATAIEGELHGVFRRWHENGQLAEEIPMEKGQPSGLSRAFHLDGSLKALALMTNGAVVKSRHWNPGEHWLEEGTESVLLNATYPVNKDK